MGEVDKWTPGPPPEVEVALVSHLAMHDNYWLARLAASHSLSPQNSKFTGQATQEHSTWLSALSLPAVSALKLKRSGGAVVSWLEVSYRLLTIYVLP